MGRILETAKNMTKEELFAMAQGLLESGIEREPVAEKWKRVNEERTFWANPVHAVAALNNGDMDHALLALLKEYPDKVLEGLSIAALAVDADAKLLYVPEGEEELARELEGKAAEYDTEIRIGIVDVRESRGGAYHHFETLKALAEIVEGTYEPVTYMAICKDGQTGSLIRVGYGTVIAHILAENGITDPESIRAIALGNKLYAPEDALQIVVEKDTDIENGVISIYPKNACMVHEADENLAVFRRASCGKCTFCREGLIQMKANTDEITHGQGQKGCISLMEEIAEAMSFSNQCTLGRTAAEFTLGTMKLFGDEYDAHIKKKKCPNNVCSAFSTVYIDPNECQGCGDCMDECPAEAIEGKDGYIHIIDEYECTKCGKCVEACEYDAIVMTTGRVPKLPTRLIKVGKFKKH